MGIEITDGLFINQVSGVVFISNPNTNSNGIWGGRAILENYGQLDVRNMIGNAILISSDGVLNNEATIKVKHVNYSGLIVLATATYFQKPSGSMHIENSDSFRRYFLL